MNDFQSLEKKIDDLREQITQLRIDVGGLKIKNQDNKRFQSMIFGAVGGVLSAVAALLAEFFRR